jgi:hypothetical protein
MWRVNQTDLSSTSGNCYQACLASILERKLEDVPHFMLDWEVNQTPKRIDRWLADQGLFMLEVCVNGPGVISLMPSNVLCIMSGPSPRFTGMHAVVGRTRDVGDTEIDLVHDPYYPEPCFFNGAPVAWTAFLGRRNLQVQG